MPLGTSTVHALLWRSLIFQGNLESTLCTCQNGVCFDRSPTSGSFWYVGKSESNLRARDLQTHFTTGESGRSTLRRTLGAILKDELSLKCIPRKDRNPTCKDFECYRFRDDGEERLTLWMHTNLEVGYVLAAPYGIPVKLLEDLIKGALKPPLNLDPAYRKANPFAATLMAMRKACVEEARTA